MVAADGSGDFPGIGEAFASGATSVFVRSGSYVVSSDVDLPAGGLLEGEAEGGVRITLTGGATIRADGSGRRITAGTVTYANGSDAVVGVGTSFTTLQVGDWISLGGIYHEIVEITDNLNLRIHHDFRGRGATGAAFVGQSMLDRVYVRSVTLVSPSDTALLFLQALHGRVEDVTVTAGTIAPGTPSILIEKSGAVSIDNVRVEDGTGCGLHFVDSSAVTISGSVVEAQGGIGIRVRGASQIINITACQILQCDGTGITVEDTSEDIRVSSSTIAQGAGIGATTAATSFRVQFAGCCFCANASHGVQIAGVNASVDGCHSKLNGGAGLNIVAGSVLATVVGNHFGFNSVWGLRAPAGGGEHTITGNIVGNNGSGGIELASNSNMIGNNAVRQNGGVGVLVSGDENVLNANRVRANVSNGIEITATASQTIVGLNNTRGNTGINLLDNGIATTLSANKS